MILERQSVFSFLLAGLLLCHPLWARSAESGLPDDDPCLAGKSLYQAGRFDEARKALLRCVATGDPDLEVLLPLTVMGLKAGRLQEAEKYGSQAVELAPEDADARYWYGRALLRNDKIEQARKQWQAGLKLSVQHKGILEGLARLALNEGEPTKAYQLLDQLRRQGVDDPWLHRLLADIAASKGMWAQSLTHLKDAMSRQDPTLSDLLAASELSLMLNDQAGAIDYCRQGVRLEPGDASYGALGEAFFAADAMDSALIYLRKAVGSDSANPRHRFNLANALEITGHVDEAEKHFQYFLAHEPDDAVGHFNYGVHLQKQDKDVEALYHINRAIELQPDMLDARIVKVQLLEKLHKYDDALTELDYLKTANPGQQKELELWSGQLVQARDEALQARQEGKIHLLHILLKDPELVQEVQEFLDGGADFGSIAIRYSSGPEAVKGGDIGWIKTSDLVEPLRQAIERLGKYDISPPIEVGGLYHFFKRLP